MLIYAIHSITLVLFSCLIEILQIYNWFMAVKDQNLIKTIHKTVNEGHENSFHKNLHCAIYLGNHR